MQLRTKANGNSILLPWHLRSWLRGGDAVFSDRPLAGGAGERLAMARDFSLALADPVAAACAAETLQPTPRR